MPMADSSTGLLSLEAQHVLFKSVIINIHEQHAFVIQFLKYVHTPASQITRWQDTPSITCCSCSVVLNIEKLKVLKYVDCIYNWYENAVTGKSVVIYKGRNSSCGMGPFLLLNDSFHICLAEAVKTKV